MNDIEAILDGPPCNCRICQEHHEWDDIIARRDPDELIKLVKNLGTRLINVEEDLEVQKAILKGDWPESAPRLAKALLAAVTKPPEARTKPAS